MVVGVPWGGQLNYSVEMLKYRGGGKLQGSAHAGLFNGGAHARELFILKFSGNWAGTSCDVVNRTGTSSIIMTLSIEPEFDLFLE